jgi:hypothetical protein
MLRYVVPSIAGKMVSRAEIDAAHHAGVDAGFVYETTGTTWSGGYVRGQEDGTRAREAVASLNAPYSCCVYHAVDSQVADSQMPLIEQWLSGLLSTMPPYRTGIYGQFSVIEMAARLRPDVFRWQTQAWSAGHVSRSADLLQLGQATINGISMDIDLAYQGHWGQWFANPARQPGTIQEDNMSAGTIRPVEVFTVPVAAGSVTKVTCVADIGLSQNQHQHVRIACHSAAKAYSQIVTLVLDTPGPHEIPITERDVDAVSFSRGINDGEAVVGYLID